MAKLDPTIDAHVHNDLNVTVERVRSFGKENRGVQLQVLAHLRATLADQSTAIEIAVFALALSLFAYFIRPTGGVDFREMNWIASLVVALILGGALAIALLPAWGPQLLRNGRQQRAQVWLAAYEDEIQRRRSRRSK